MGTTAGSGECEDHPVSLRQYEIQKEMEDPVAFVTSTNPDIVYLHEVMRTPNCDQFLKAMDKELDDHISCEHWAVIPNEEKPAGTKLFDMVWAMCQKEHINTREVYKLKARLNVHGSQKVHRVNYWETYAPMVSWPMLRFFFILSLLGKWKTRQTDFVLAYFHAPAEVHCT